MLNVHRCSRIILFDTLLDSIGNATCHAVTSSGSGSILHLIHGLDLIQQDSLSLEHAGQFLKGNNKIHIGTYRTSAGFQLLGSAGANEYYGSIRMLLLDQTGCCNHRGQFITDLINGLREQILRHYRPGRTTGGQGKLLLTGSNLLHVVLRFRHTSHVSAQRCLIDIRKPQFLQRCLEHLRCHLRTELSDKCRCYLGYDLPAGLHGTDQLEDLRLVSNRSKRTAYHTLTAGYTFLIVDHGSSQMVRCNSSNTAGSLTGTLFVTNRIIRADFTTLSALDAFFLINNRLAVFHRDRTLGTNTLAGMCQAPHAGAGHLITVLRAGITRRRNDLHQRGFVIFFINITLLQTLCQMAGMLAVLRA